MSRAGEQERIVVIGAGQAAAQLAISLRQGEFAGDIVVIGAEPFPPYQRPPLSKKFLTERPAPDSLFLRPESFWRDLNVDMQLGVAAAAIDPYNKVVTLADGRELGYRELVLATGTRAAALPVPGAGARKRLLAARHRRRAPPAAGARRGRARRHRRRRLYRPRGGSGAARRGHGR